MKRVLGSVALLGLALSLSGCSLFYPNWGATTAPVDTPTETASPTIEPTPTQTPKPTPKQPVAVDILQSNADAAGGTVSVIAQASGVSEDGGICTLNIIQGSNAKSVSAKAESNVTDTQCFPLTLSIVGLAPGDATFTVSYDSSAYSGKSVPQVITIP